MAKKVTAFKCGTCGELFDSPAGCAYHEAFVHGECAFALNVDATLTIPLPGSGREHEDPGYVTERFQVLERREKPETSLQLAADHLLVKCEWTSVGRAHCQTASRRAREDMLTRAEKAAQAVLDGCRKMRERWKM